MALPEVIDHAVELIHRIVGYPLAFMVGPAALATFAGAPGHRSFGKAYAAGMTFLYVSGTALTLTRHPWGTWEFGRNVTFNLLGYSLLLHGFRAMWLRTHRDGPHPTLVDRVLLASLATLAAAAVALATQRGSTPMHVFAALAVALVVIEVHEWRAGLTPQALYRRHVRYMLGSYFYVLTVVSLVHLRDELPGDLRWLWPTALGVVLLWFVGESRRTTRWAVRLLLAVSLAFGVYAGWEVVREHGRIERVLGMIVPPLELRDEVQVQAGDLVAA